MGHLIQTALAVILQVATLNRETREKHNPHLRMAVPFWNRVTSAIVSGISAKGSHLSSVYATIPCSSPSSKTNIPSENQLVSQLCLSLISKII